MEAKKRVVKSKNGVPLWNGDMVQLVGKRPPNPVVGYVDTMERMLDNGKYYRIEKIRHTKHGETVVRVNNWNWDIRNIYKEGGEPVEVVNKPVTFDPKLLDV